MNYELIRMIIAILFTSMAASYDIFNKKNIPDLLLYSFLGCAILISIIDFNFHLLIYSLIIAGVIGTVGYLLYKAGQLGGADVFILCSLSLLLPIQPRLNNSNTILNLPFIFSILFVAGLFFIIYVLIKFTPIILKRKEKLEIKKIIYTLPVLFAFIFFLVMAPSIKIPNIFIILIGFFVFVSIYFSIFKDRFMKALIEELPLDKIECEDVIAIEYMDEKLVKKYSIPRVISEEDLKNLKGINIKKYPVYSKLPMFVPFILIGLLISLYFGDILYLLTTSLI